MRRSIPFWQFAGFVFTSIMGTLLHFLFDWSGRSVVVGLFSAVNESIWEHMKLIVFPMLLFACVEWFILRKRVPSFWCAATIGIVTAAALIPTLFYLYSGALGISSDYVNITIFYVAAAFAYWLQVRLFSRGLRVCRPFVAVAVLVCMAAAFWVLTFCPIHIPLFEDPLTGAYGFIR